MTDTLKPPDFLKNFATLVLSKPHSTQLRSKRKKLLKRWTNSVQLTTKKRIEPHTSASPFNLQNSDIYDSSFHSLYSSNEVSVLDFDPWIFTDPLTSKSLSDDTHSNALNILISAEGENLMYIPLKFEKDVRRKALIDTGACSNAVRADFYEKMKTHCPNSVSEIQQASLLNVKVASRRTVKVLAQVNVKFKIIEHHFDDVFLILPSRNSVVLGNPFFEKYNIEICPG